MATRQQRLDAFAHDGEPPAHEPLELLCEDHVGTYVLPFDVFRLFGSRLAHDVPSQGLFAPTDILARYLISAGTDGRSDQATGRPLTV